MNNKKEHTKSKGLIYSCFIKLYHSKEISVNFMEIDLYYFIMQKSRYDNHNKNRYSVIDTLLPEVLILLKNNVEILGKGYQFMPIYGIIN